MHPLPQALTLNPKADAQALAHESLVRAEAHTKPDSLAMQELESQPSLPSGHQHRIADASTANAGMPMLMWPKGFLIAGLTMQSTTVCEQPMLSVKEAQITWPLNSSAGADSR